MPTIPLLEILIYLIKHPRINLRCTCQAHAQRKIVQAGDADGLAVEILVDGRDGGEDEVDEAVDEGHVDAEQLDDGFAREEGEGPDHAFGEDAFPAVRRGEWGWLLLLIRVRKVKRRGWDTYCLSSVW